jgi:hypothetical protein
MGSFGQPIILVTVSPLTIGSSDRRGRVLGESRRESMIRIKQLRLIHAQPRVAQSHR